MFEPTVTGLGDASLTTDRSAVPVIARACENSEVLPCAFVAVAVTTWPGVTGAAKFKLKLAFPAPSVFTTAVSRKVCPSPKPEGSAFALE